MDEVEFKECPLCASKPGAPDLCESCIGNRYTINSLKQKLSGVIDAWESLPGNQQQTAQDVERWLISKMSPAINEARSILGRPNEPEDDEKALDP